MWWSKPRREARRAAREARRAERAAREAAEKAEREEKLAKLQAQIAELTRELETEEAQAVLTKWDERDHLRWERRRMEEAKGCAG